MVTCEQRDLKKALLKNGYSESVANEIIKWYS